jgi:trimethylamine--corrinoid protein Co-methyltransferase
MIPKDDEKQFSLTKNNILGEKGVRKIHETSLKVLEEVGIVIKHEHALEIFNQAGAKINWSQQRVKIPPKIIETAIKCAPAQFVHEGANPENNVTYSVIGKCITRPISGVNLILDLKTTKPRKVNVKDVENWIQLTDQLSNIDVVASIHPQDVPQSNCDVHVLAKMLQYTDKPIMMSAYSGKNIKWWKELLAFLPKQNPNRLICLSSVNSPLNYDQTQCDLALACAENDIALILSAPGLAGAQSPVTLAGSLVQINAEILAAITLVQIAKPGLPIIYPGYPAIFDLQRGEISFGSAEQGLLVNALIELGQSYGLPTSSVGTLTDSIICDQQAGIEKVMAIYLSFLKRTSMIGGAGSLGQAGISSFEQLLIDDDIFGAFRRQMRGITINDDTLALDVIARVGPEHNYLNDPHTFAFMRTEYYRSTIANRFSASAWERKGGNDIWNRAEEQVRILLEKPKIPILEDAAVRELAHLVNAIDQDKAS